MTPEIISREEGNITRLELRVGEERVSRLNILRFTIRIGAAQVRMDGIGGVGTEEAHRHRGYARRLLEAAIRRMISGDGALSMLYGISDFYPKFGYATAGPSHLLQLPAEPGTALRLPDRWQVRPLAPEDLPAVRALYDQSLAGTTGAALREAAGRSWARLAALAEGTREDQCRVVTVGECRVVAYAWRCQRHWAVTQLERQDLDALVLGEVVAVDPTAADALLAVCRAWAGPEGQRRGTPVRHVTTALPPAGVVASAAMRQSARFLQDYRSCGGSMARTLDAARLLKSLEPELNSRWQSARPGFRGHLRLETEVGGCNLDLSSEMVIVADDPPQVSIPTTVRLAQYDLARLALGAFPPADLIARLPAEVPDPAREALLTLFPRRHPHMPLPDRF